MKQRGMVLILSLIFLVVISLLAMAGMRGGLLQEKMVGNYKETQLALQAAETALREAERYLDGGDPGPFDNSAGLYDLLTTAVDPHANTTTWRSYTNAGSAGPLPQYYIERLPFAQAQNDSLAADEAQGERRLYRITARGFGLSADSQVLLQTTFSR
ncbi:pilus assembly PilX family protein [Aeromonas sp. 164P]